MATAQDRRVESAAAAASELAMRGGVSGAGNGVADARLQAAWLQWARQVVAQTEDVGDRFAQEARRIHYGESEDRAIRGRATPEQTAELLEEGVAVMPLLLPDSAKETLQ